MNGKERDLLIELQTDIKWIRSRMDEEVCLITKYCDMNDKWKTDHETEHKSLVAKMITGIAVLASAVAGFISWMMK